MRTLFGLFLFVSAIYLSAQNDNNFHFRKYAVAGSGAYVYLPAQPEWETSFSEDSSKMYTTNIISSGVTYSVIVVCLAELQDNNPKDWENLLASYMEFLFTQFQLSSASNPGYGHTLESHPTARGILEYAENAQGNQYILKGWTDQATLAVMIINYPDEESAGKANINIQNIFLNGFRFPEKE